MRRGAKTEHIQIYMGLPSKTLLATDKIGDASVQSQKGKLSGYLAGAAVLTHMKMSPEHVLPQRQGEK